MFLISPNLRENWRAVLANTVTTSHRWLSQLELHQVKNPFLSYTNRISSAQLPHVASGYCSEQAGRGHFCLLDSTAGELSWLSSHSPSFAGVTFVFLGKGRGRGGLITP